MTLLNVFYLMGIVFGIFFLFMNGAVFFGGDMDSDGMDSGDADSGDADGGSGIMGEALTVRSLMTFLTFFGWIGVCCIEQGYSDVRSVISAVILSFILTMLLATIMLGFKKLQSVQPDLNASDYVGKTAKVYLLIPGKGKAGKIQLIVRGSLRTIDALSDTGHIIESNSQVIVTEFISDNLVKVKPN